jgi:hypothetical protein
METTMKSEMMENHPHSPSPSSPFSPNHPVGLGLQALPSSQSPYADGPSAQAGFAAFDGSDYLAQQAQSHHHHQFAQQQQHQQHQQHNHHHLHHLHQPASATDPSGQSVYDNEPHGASEPSLHGAHINGAGPPQYASQSQPSFLTTPDFSSAADVALYSQSSPGPHEQQFPLFDTMASPQSQVHHSPTPPHLLGVDPSVASHPHSAAASPSFASFGAAAAGGGGGHSRNISLGPEAAMMQSHMADWARPPYQAHRRSISEISDLSSAVPSPHVLAHDSFDDQPGHSPLQQTADHSMIMGIGNFTLSDHGASPSLVGRSPSHSPAPSPRMMPQPMGPDMNGPFGLGVQTGYMGGGGGAPAGYPTLTTEAFPSLRPSPHTTGPETPQMAAPPIINVDFAPTNARQGFEHSKALNQDSLMPDRGALLSSS